MLGSASSLLRRARHSAGVSQRELARRAGIPPASVSEIETGKRDPTVSTLVRLLRAADRCLTIGPCRWTASAVADEIGSCLRAGREDVAFRLLLEFLDDVRATGDRDLLAMVADPPNGTGMSRFDAFLAALVEHSCAAARTPCPRWTSDPGRFAEPWWFVATMHAPALVDNPISFTRHGVVIGSRGLTRA